MKLARKTVLLTLVAGLAVAGAAIPSGAANAKGGGGVTPPTTGSGNSGGTPSYSVTVQGNVNITGNVHGGGGIDETYQPPNCWIQPWFQQPESWVQGDPQGVGDPRSASDADTFWWDMADKYPGLRGLIAHVPEAEQEINQDFEMVQKGQNDSGGGAVSSDWVWWAPNWLNNSQGFACAQGLVSSIGMNNGFLDLEPPQAPDNGAPGQITGQELAGLARAALRLPRVVIHTEPNGTTDQSSAYVNSPTKLYLTYNPSRQPTDTASVVYVGGTYLTATITTSVPTITVTTNDPGATINNNGTCLQNSMCSITFNGPTTTGNPYTVTVTATWTVNWTTSDGGAGTFTQPPSQVTATHTVIVREIQSLN
jgi:hypothetical protein